MAGEWISRAWDNLEYSVETGKSGAEKALGMPVFDWMAQRPEEVKRFSETMVGVHGEEPAAIAAAYDFSGLGTIVDVGSATGNLLSTILARHTGPRGILFDMPHVVGDARPLIESRGLSDRISIATGSFFDAVPEGGDAYILSHVIHDWNEEQCLTILGNVRRAMKPGARCAAGGDGAAAGQYSASGQAARHDDAGGTGGQERTEPEYAELLAKAGLRLSRVVRAHRPRAWWKASRHEVPHGVSDVIR